MADLKWAFAGCALAASWAVPALAQSGDAPARAAPPMVTWEALRSRPHPRATHRVAYGADPLQFADLWLPKGDGPFPVVIMIHGGCWQSAVAGADLMDFAAADLAHRGVAVWNIEYRGVDRPGGGYPGTFQDAAAAVDALAPVAPRYRLNLDRVVVLGHSAGGHLALWLAARPRLPASSPLRTSASLKIAAVVSLGALPDLAEARDGPDQGCGRAVIDQLVGAPGRGASGGYADTSPPELAPLGVPQTLVAGARDTIAPPHFSQAYAARVELAGDRPVVTVVPDQGHFDLIAPETPAWAVVVNAVDQALGFKP
jgi:acetyl esterase/lipase